MLLIGLEAVDRHLRLVGGIIGHAANTARILIGYGTGLVRRRRLGWRWTIVLSERCAFASLSLVLSIGQLQGAKQMLMSGSRIEAYCER